MLKDVYDASSRASHKLWKSTAGLRHGVFDSAWRILVEGRADVVNLLRAGYDHAIAIEGGRIEESVTKITEGKRVVALLDGDRQEPNMKELAWSSQDRQGARDPQGKEVEECTPLEIRKS